MQVLREENNNLLSELMELRNDLSLRNEQVGTHIGATVATTLTSSNLSTSFDKIYALKVTIRELEASLFREQEFNASHRRINADYLVNILRKFLMTIDPSERSKLVGVLCSILHLLPDETKVINEKWAVRPTGLAGWFSGGSSSNSSASYGHGQTGSSAAAAPNSGGSSNEGGVSPAGNLEFIGY